MSRIDQRIFVFGSNLEGRHGKGAALYARSECGAIYGQGRGLQGRSFAIPTKNAQLKSLSLDEIHKEVDHFLNFARMHLEMSFQVTPIGCGLAGYLAIDIAPMFARAPKNCDLPEGWRNMS